MKRLPGKESSSCDPRCIDIERHSPECGARAGRPAAGAIHYRRMKTVRRRTAPTRLRAFRDHKRSTDNHRSACLDAC